ncbi:ferric reductase-like transmembrane domain-containing protein [Clostridium sardiniense]|uniref:ferric reductase-like transmembrane domain-containing protein n=1 Tax=Clostridium sardiniense TaxID=29369 RepID=UPI001959C37F|nr:ferric reductase-like transmembrane domain-containing protein [Clostridium sardiniense]MBM7836231.1 DMSO/TMAO reductase YedYZ heme-binding membrane subunit [Clostridium sardiniense]
MLLIISILILSALGFFLNKQIKSHANILYLISALIAIFFITYSRMKLNIYFPEFVNKYLISIFSRGTISLALFTIVMYTGALSRSLTITKRFMSIRAELSIIACILTLGHNILYGFYYFPVLFTNPSSLSTYKLIATLMTIVMICLMIPLMVTSFPSVRRKMPYNKWKKIQRSAYVFYGLIYIHIMLLFIPKIQKGKLSDVLIYSFVFLMYYILRIHKHIKKIK